MDGTAPIILPRQLVQQIFHQAQASPKTEVCGLIGGMDGEPVSAYPIPNVSRQPGQLFDMDPKAQVGAMRDMRERGETLFAIYHSHPTAPPEPSREDLDRMTYPDAYYFIVSLNIKGVLEMRAWRIVEDAWREITLKILRG